MPVRRDTMSEDADGATKSAEVCAEELKGEGNTHFQARAPRCCRLVLGAYLANFSGFFFALFFFATTAPGYA